MEKTFPLSSDLAAALGCPEAAIQATRYAHGNALAVQLWSHQPAGEEPVEPLATLSVNIEPYSRSLPERCFFAKTYSENAEVARDAALSGWFAPRFDLPPRTSGWEICTVWELREERGEGFTDEELMVEGMTPRGEEPGKPGNPDYREACE